MEALHDCPGSARARTLCVAAVLVVAASPLSAQEPVIGGPCEGCEYVFAGMPDSLGAEAWIVPPEQPGERMVIDGAVRWPDGTPAAGVIVYAYQTDRDGIYPEASTRHGALRGWALTDRDGRYRFHTIRPGSYPGSNIPQHVHMHVIEPGRATYWIDDVEFEDDPLLTPEMKRGAQGRGGRGICQPVRDDDGVWRVRRDIALGEAIPGYGE